MHINTFALMSSSVLLSSTLALAGDAEQVILRLDTVQAKPGELVSVSISMETTELVGGFEFTLSAESNDVTEIGWDGPLFSNGWEGWDTPNADNSRTVSAACIFTEDQVEPGDYLLVNAVRPGSSGCSARVVHRIRGERFMVRQLRLRNGRRACGQWWH